MAVQKPDPGWLEEALAVRGEDLRGDFHEQLAEVDDTLVAAGQAVVDALPGLIRAFLAGEQASINDAEAMAADVEGRCRAVEDAGFVLLAREAPVGGDLRRLVAILRTTVDIERSASLLRHVSGSLRWFDPGELPAPITSALAELATRSGRVFQGGLNAWRQRDALAVADLEAADDAVDELQTELLDASAEADLGSESMVIGLITRYFERIADHGVALARDAAFVVTGERVGREG